MSGSDVAAKSCGEDREKRNDCQRRQRRIGEPIDPVAGSQIGVDNCQHADTEEDGGGILHQRPATGGHQQWHQQAMGHRAAAGVVKHEAGHQTDESEQAQPGSVERAVATHVRMSSAPPSTRMF